MRVLKEPLSAPEAKRLIRQILESGTISYTEPHAHDEMRKDGVTMVDVENVLRGGVVEPGEWENGAWRYRVRTAAICVVVEFVGESELFVITAWRFKR
jgi:hypothetical protein